MIAASSLDGFEAFELSPQFTDPIAFPGYRKQWERAGRESVTAGIGDIGGFSFVAVFFDFSVLGGSLGVGAGDVVTQAFDKAAELRLPIVAFISSGGARMQEGMAALGQMPRTVAASRRAADMGVLRVSVLGSPTTGGVYASFGSLADLIVGVRGATVGFAGPRVAAAFGTELPSGSHTAEAAFDAGLIDALVDEDEVTGWLRTMFDVLSGATEANQAAAEVPPPTDSAPAGAWDQFLLARHPDRPSPRDIARALSPQSVELRGDRTRSDDDQVFAAIANVGRPTVLVCVGRGRPGPAGFRKASRAIRLASRLGFPIVTMIDTPGADPSPDSEYGGLASAIAHCFDDLLSASVPVVTLVTGEGGSGGALALACGDLIGIMEHAVFSVIAPEGAASILHRDPERAEEVAPMLKPTSHDLLALGLADEIVAEPEGGAHTDPDSATGWAVQWIREAVNRAVPEPEGRVRRYGSPNI